MLDVIVTGLQPGTMFNNMPAAHWHTLRAERSRELEALEAGEPVTFPAGRLWPRWWAHIPGVSHHTTLRLDETDHLSVVGP